MACSRSARPTGCCGGNGAASKPTWRKNKPSWIVAATAPRTAPNAAQFLRLISAVQGKSGRAQLEEANLGVNAAIRYVSDYAQFGEADRWSAPLASFATAKGDCEDYAIAKYVALQQAGFPRDDLRLVLGRDRSLGQDHAVLAARLDGRWLILDSRRPELLEDLML